MVVTVKTGFVQEGTEKKGDCLETLGFARSRGLYQRWTLSQIDDNLSVRLSNTIIITIATTTT